MKIKKLIIHRGILEPIQISFDKYTVITSDENAKGKTTLIRFLLHSFGYKIPSTKKVDMTEHITILEIENSQGLLSLEREGENLTITFGDGTSKHFNLNSDDNRLLVQSIVFESNNFDFLNNLLMVMYIDQDRGWTLLNRGKAIGNNRFDINDFVAAISGINVGEINNKLKNVDNEIKKYRALRNMVSIKESFEYEKSQDEQQGVEERNRLLTIKTELKIRIDKISNHIKTLESIYKGNANMVEYIASYNLLIRHRSGESFVLMPDDIVDFDINQNILDYQIKNEYLKIERLNQELIEINSKLREYDQLFNVQESTSEIINSVITSNIDVISIDRIITSLGKEKKSLNKQKNETIVHRSDVINKITNNIINFSKEVGVYENLIAKEKNLLFTSNLKQYSGSILHKIVFVFRLALNIAASEKIGIDLPFIFDSPGAAELTIDNIKQLILLAKNNLKTHQIIISTIHKDILKLFKENTNNVHLDKLLLDI